VRRTVLAIACSALLLGGCDTVDDVRTTAEGFSDEAAAVRERGRQLSRDAKRITKTVRKRVEKVLDDLEQAVPEASTTTRPPTRGSSEIEAYLIEVITDVDKYWTATLKKSGLAAPRVSYTFLEPGERRRTGCRFTADDDAAFYCTGDDTIYVAQRFASRLAQSGDAVGDFGVAYVIAHEYAHNVQTELGFFGGGIDQGVKPFELQADCMAGLWANSSYAEGKVTPEDVEEAISTAQAVGDFEFASNQHHGTPDERRDAWLKGFRSGKPSECTLGN